MAIRHTYSFQAPNIDLNSLFQEKRNEWAQNERNAWETRFNDILSGGIGALSGISGMIGVGQQLQDVQETPWFDAQLYDMRSLGSRDYNDANGLANEMAQNNYGLRQTYEDRRGLTKGQEAGLIGASALSGAAAGHSIGKNFGLIGDIVGTGIGLFGGGISGWLNMNEGRRAARIQTGYDNSLVNVAQNNAGLTYQSEGEEIADFNHRGLASHVVRNGGQINTQTRQENIQQFANRVLGKKSNLPTRTYCKGGVMVKVKMK